MCCVLAAEGVGHIIRVCCMRHHGFHPRYTAYGVSARFAFEMKRFYLAIRAESILG